MDNENPTVSVIIPTYNRAHLIGRSIQSVLDQTYRDFEIIVVDDGSTDNTENVVKTFNDSRIRHIKHKDNRGGSAARNTGIKLAKGGYIAFQDSDDEWLPTKLEKQMKAFRKTSDEVGVVYTGFYRIENNIKNYIPSSLIPKKEGYIHKTLLNGNFVTTQAAIVKKECFKKAGMFDERLPRLQDWELWIRISKYYNFECIDEPLVQSYYQSVSISSNQDALITALMMILEKHSIDFNENKKVIAPYYFTIGSNLYFNGKRDGWKNYYCNVIKMDPFNIRLIVSIFISLFGKNVYDTFVDSYQKIKTINF